MFFHATFAYWVQCRKWEQEGRQEFYIAGFLFAMISLDADNNYIFKKHSGHLNPGTSEIKIELNKIFIYRNQSQSPYYDSVVMKGHYDVVTQISHSLICRGNIVPTPRLPVNDLVGTG